MSEFKINCPHCRQRILCDESHEGQEVQCPGCSQNLVVPQQSVSLKLHQAICPGCGQSNPAGAARCPDCGYQKDARNKPPAQARRTVRARRGWSSGFLGPAIGLAIMGVLAYFFTSEGQWVFIFYALQVVVAGLLLLHFYIKFARHYRGDYGERATGHGFFEFIGHYDMD